MIDRTLEKIEEKRKNRLSWILAAPVLLWLVILFLIPYLIVIIYSFLTPTIYDIQFAFSLESFKRLVDPIYLRSFYISFRLAVVTTIACIFLGYPVAYYIARKTEKVKNILLLLIIIPFWTNFIIRIFAWRIFISANGLLNELLMFAGIIDDPLRILRTDLAVTMVMIYVYLPYMILPLYANIEKIDFTLIEAAMDLGANRLKSFLKVTLPLSKEGIFAGSILVFIPALGAYIIPQLVGNQDYLYVGQIIAYKIKSIPRNWPLASALSLGLLVLVIVMLILLYWFYKRVIKKENKLFFNEK
ncbi:MAG: ABC transporter permease [Ignavibacteria bacterium]|nr:ABC transporter permease [Ignavibacteria bacterium]